MKQINTEDFHEPVGHYSPAVISNGFVFVSGQLAVEPKTGEATGGSIEDQTERCLRNLELVLESAGSSLDRVVKVTIYVSDESHWGPVNDVYKRIFDRRRPARAIIPVGDFREPFLLEVEAVAEAPADA